MISKPSTGYYIYKREFNSPSTPPVILSPKSDKWTQPSYQLKVVCPFCFQTGYSQWNVVRLDIMKSFPLCWEEECCYCKQTFNVGNGIDGVCVHCTHHLDCLDKPSGQLELLENF